MTCAPKPARLSPKQPDRKPENGRRQLFDACLENSGELIPAEYPTETDKYWGFEKEQDRPIIFRGCAQLRVKTQESKEKTTYGGG